AFALDLDDRRADGEHGAGRHLDLDDTTIHRAHHLRAPLELAGKLFHLPAGGIYAKQRLLPIPLALRLEIQKLRLQLQNFRLGIGDALLGIGQLTAAILDVAPRLVSFRQNPFELTDHHREIGNALFRRPDRLLDTRLQRSETLRFGGELAIDRGHQIGMLPHALVIHLDGIAITVLTVGLRDAGDDLIPRHAIVYGNV